MELTYAMLDTEGVIINVVVAQKDDFEMLDKIKVLENADSYREIDPEVYLIRVGLLYWNGSTWDKVSNK
jgi:hypothetical protein